MFAKWNDDCRAGSLPERGRRACASCARRSSGCGCPRCSWPREPGRRSARLHPHGVPGPRLGPSGRRRGARPRACGDRTRGPPPTSAFPWRPTAARRPGQSRGALVERVLRGAAGCCHSWRGSRPKRGSGASRLGRPRSARRAAAVARRRRRAARAHPRRPLVGQRPLHGARSRRSSIPPAPCRPRDGVRDHDALRRLLGPLLRGLRGSAGRCPRAGASGTRSTSSITCSTTT